MQSGRIWIKPQELEVILRDAIFNKASILLDTASLPHPPIHTLHRDHTIYIAYASKTGSKGRGLSVYDTRKQSIVHIDSSLADLYVFDMAISNIYPDLGIWIATNNGLVNIDSSSTPSGKVEAKFFLKGKEIQSLCTDGELIYFISGNVFYKFDPLTTLAEEVKIKEDVSQEVITSIFVDDINNRIISLLDRSSVLYPSVLIYEKGEIKSFILQDCPYPQCGITMSYGHIYLGLSGAVSIHSSRDFNLSRIFRLSSSVGLVLSMARVKAKYHELIFFCQGGNLYVSYYITHTQILMDIYGIYGKSEPVDVFKMLLPFIQSIIPIDLGNITAKYIYDIKYVKDYLLLCADVGVVKVPINYLLEKINP